MLSVLQSLPPYSLGVVQHMVLLYDGIYEVTGCNKGFRIELCTGARVGKYRATTAGAGIKVAGLPRDREQYVW